MAGPLSNVRVLELGRLYAAPWASQMLADFGAEVIKIEAPDGDPMRQMGLGVVRDSEGRETSERSLFSALNRNKKSVSLDLGSRDGQELVRKLAARCDVLIENYKVGDLARRGLDYETICAVNPRIIYLSLTGYGQTGPYKDRPAMDNIVQGVSGFMSMTGQPGDPPQPSPVAIMDFSAGMHAAVGLLVALYARDVRGAGGQYIDLALLDSAVAILGYKMIATLLSGEEPPRGRRTRGFIPGGAFETADGWIQLTVGSDVDFRRFCTATGRPDLLDDPRYADRWLRTENQEPLLADVAAMLKERPAAYWLERMVREGLMSGPVQTLAQAAQDPQVVARGLVVRVPHVLGGTAPLVGNPLKMSGTPVEAPRCPPLLGADTEHVLTELIGLSAEEIADLRARGALGAGAPAPASAEK